ncbi:MAG: phosphatidylserine decarboxylase family protein [Bacteroidia bacterium]|nr:phosphatidylserine decarboxylase family protein [Bacteroidia bacterium]
MTFRLHREGRTIIPVSFLIIAGILAGVYFLTKDSAGIYFFYLLLVTGIVFFGLILNFFRNPSFDIPFDSNHILSPCDGKVVVIEEVMDSVYFNEKVTQISVFMSPLNVHVNRNPIGGTVQYYRYIKGEFLVAFDPKSSERNERTYVVTKNDKITVAYKQIAGYVARRICCYIKEGDKVAQGAEFGFIKFGSRIDILIPVSCKVKVQLDEVVKAGRSVLAVIE